MKNKQSGYTLIELIVILIIPIGIACLGLWIANIVKLSSMDCGMCGKEILRIVGIFVAPLGIGMGFVSN